ncbi:hypothetical protein MKW98_024288 [Papaver atlanticum]|uniref:Maintenance of Photosystem II under High light 2 C-terminal domain-containing protein n=1 Tax=Papaver atlanticum TaxID=357466 RepID=A0AAD4XPJ2_9MAGN|nr:hypothetical protein MKW98_024288 [Papaver atlanticum]
MATAFLSTAKTLFLPSLLSSSSLTSSTATATQNLRTSSSSLKVTLCKATSQTPTLTKRNLALSLTATFSLLLTGNGLLDANATILEADDDLELLEKVKQDRKKRLEQQEIISSAGNEKEYLQDLIYKLSKVGQAIENNDLSAASSVLSPSNKNDWQQKVNEAFAKLSSSAEEKTEVDTFNSSLSTLISSVTQNDINSAKTAFLSSAVALEKWTVLTGLVGQLKGI